MTADKGVAENLFFRKHFFIVRLLHQVIIQGTIHSVSYTHLDVYKRQVLRGLPGMAVPFKGGRDRRVPAFQTICAGPLHQDVYKRQSINSEAA